MNRLIEKNVAAKNIEHFYIIYLRNPACREGAVNVLFY